MKQQHDQLQQCSTVQISPLQNQPARPASTQPTAEESAAPTTGQADRSSSTPLQDTGLIPLPTVNTVPSTRLGTLQVSFDNNNTQGSHSHMSQLSGPLFTEDILSTSSGSDQEMCDQEVKNITRACTPSETSTLVMSPRPGSSATVNYSTQGDPDQPAYSPVSDLAHEQQLILNSYNYLLLDGSGRRIYDLPASQHQPFILGNGNAAYQIKLENLEAILETNTFLMERLTGKFHAVYENGYRQMATTPKLLHTWQSGQFIAKLDEAQLHFGLPSNADTSPARQQAASRHLPSQ